MDSEEFNTDLFIDEIEKRPPIWDMTSSQYSNKISKRKAWEEIVLIFGDPSDTEERKKCLGVTLQKKWKSLRDNYVKESKKCKIVKSGSEAPKKSTYLHFERLRFLQKSIEKNITESSFYANDENPKRSVDTNDANGTFKTLNITGDSSTKAADEHIANVPGSSLAQKQVPGKQEDYEDELYCLSLLKDMQKVPKTKRLNLKIELYNLILKHQNMPPSSNIGCPKNDATTSYDTGPRRHHQECTTIEKNNDQQQLTSSSSPSPTPSNVSEVSQESILDLFEEN